MKSAQTTVESREIDMLSRLRIHFSTLSHHLVMNVTEIESLPHEKMLPKIDRFGIQALYRKMGGARMSICKASEQYLHQLRQRYRKATKKQPGRILDEFVETTGYHRKHAIALLRGRRQHRNRQVPIRHSRQRIYTDEDKRAVLWLAELFDQIGSKRQRAAIDVELKAIYRTILARECGLFQAFTTHQSRDDGSSAPRRASSLKSPSRGHETRHTPQIANSDSHFRRLGQ